MKKKNVINLIRYYSEDNDVAFKNEAYEVAKYFDSIGDSQLAEYIMALLSDANVFVPQMSENESSLFEKVENKGDVLLLPENIMQDLLGIVNAISHNAGINKFLFQGAPGTGKTEAVKHLARILDREIFMVEFGAIIDSKLGQTQKNISNLFKEINSFAHPDKVIILFDEIDALALDRTNSNDLREMGRATSAMLKGMDYLDERAILIATTNLYEHFDKALNRRFDYVVSFDRYSQKDLMDIAEELLNGYLKKFKLTNKDVRLFRKILSLSPLPNPGDLKNLIKTAIAFSNPDDGLDYFRRLYFTVNGEKADDIEKLKSQGFSLREMEILAEKPKTSIARELKVGNENE